MESFYNENHVASVCVCVCMRVCVCNECIISASVCVEFSCILPFYFSLSLSLSPIPSLASLTTCVNIEYYCI